VAAAPSACQTTEPLGARLVVSLVNHRADPSTSPIMMYTTSTCGDCRAAKMALERKGLAFVEVNIEHDDEARKLVESLNDGRRSVPTLVHGVTSASLSRFAPAKLDAFLAGAGLHAGAGGHAAAEAHAAAEGRAGAGRPAGAGPKE
jgi:mycoredoxin